MVFILADDVGYADLGEYEKLAQRLHAKFLEHNDHDSQTFHEPRTTPVHR